MKAAFLFVLGVVVCISIRAQSLLPNDSLTFHFDTPQIGDYITVPILWGCNDNLRPDGAKMLNDCVVTIMKRYHNLIFQLESHSDCRGDSLYNRQYTQRRADSMLVYLLSRNVDSSRIKAIGMGEDDLFYKKCDCGLSDYRHICTEAEHQRNRRTVLRVVGIKQD